MRHLARLFALIVCTAAAAIASGADVNIAFKVKVPPTTPADAKVYLAGDAQPLGAWKEDGVELTKGDDGTWGGQLKLPADREIQYKLTRGSWASVEKNADGSDISNRTFRPTRDATVEIEVAAWADQVQAPEVKPTRTGDIRTHEKFASKHLNNERNLLVWLPPGYDANADQRYPVLYMHDGQNAFDASTSFSGEWRADETAAALIEAKRIPPIIIVAIENNRWRIDEYTMSRDERRGAGGRGAAYVKFVAEEVKPFIDQTYRAKPDRASTAVAGSSLGGTISLEIARAYPQQFGRVAAISPALWWNDSELLKRLGSDAAWMKDARIWVDVGTAEGEATQHAQYVDGVKRLEALLKREGKDQQVRIIEGAAHNEKDWAERFDDVLVYLFASDP